MRPWIFAVAAAIPIVAFAQGVLQIGEPTVESNQVTIPVYLGGNVGAGVAAADFRITYDPQVLRPVSAIAGSAAADADKRVMANEAASGEYVVVMMGMNQTALTSGEIARVVMERTPNAGPGQWKLGLSRPTLSTTDGGIIESAVAPYTPTGQPDETDEPAETAPDKTDAEKTSDPVRGEPQGNHPAGLVLEREASAARPGLNRQESRDDKMASLSGKALKQYEEALQSRGEARDAIATPSAGRLDNLNSAKPDETEKTGANDLPAAQKAAQDKAARLAAIKTFESTRSNPEGRAATSRMETENGPAGGTGKAIAAGIAAGVAMAILSLIVLRRKVFG
ncbi:MAG TPA: cohesin domain-containing protein [Candidatus Hydrogenedentes bacterium]|nr:cohesin domain-containing protein [Candidatus Hydrogenedentota bacterium]HPC18065.1 cohesin domain-containing protein [Candidatus Hydrogenedentota bacterium]HRT21955.1 cohesin domain-containing protein [Candidatus Hydrogenedentota bacterium]HRT66516.1 cohesin domain-containing protein [Candidatus Hydrogenedentota bacterium]